MPAGMLLDTSFLITLAGTNRAHPETARRYWKHFLENQIPIYLSTVVVSEFCIKQEIPPDMLRCCRSTGTMRSEQRGSTGNGYNPLASSAMHSRTT